MADEERVGLQTFYPDEPSKSELFRLDELYLIINDPDACRGFVTWDASPPANIAYSLHMVTILDAFRTGFAFLRTRLAGEWVLLGPHAVAVVRGLTMFIEDTPQERGRCILFGSVGRIKVYADPDMADPEGWYVGCQGMWVRGLIINSPLNFTRH